MRTAWASLAVLLALSSSAMAAERACLSNNRLVSTRVIDNSTIAATDRTGNRYTIHMRGRCVGLTRNSEYVSFRTKTQLGCIGPGDTVGYNQPGEGTVVRPRGSVQTRCFIDHVTAGAPPQRGRG